MVRGAEPRSVPPALSSVLALAGLLSTESLLLALAYFGSVSPRHLLLILVAGLLPWPLLLLRRIVDSASGSERLTGRLLLGAVAAGAGVVLAVKHYGVWQQGRDFLPAVHDEWSYLFGARVIAAGRLTAPAPPAPELFRQVHVLVLGDRWMSRYPPGHLAMLALGVTWGRPFLVPICSVALVTAALVYWVGRRTGSAYAAVLLAALLVCCPGLDLAGTTYLSQSSFLLWATLAVVLAVDAVLEDRPLRASLAALAAGAAALTRPYSAVVMFAPLAVVGGTMLVLERGSKRFLRHAAATMPPLLLTLLLWFAYNFATTGSPFESPWEVYNARFEPANTLGVAPIDEPPNLPADPVLRRKALGIQQERQRFTLREAIERSFLRGDRLRQYVGATCVFVGATLLVGAAFVSAAARRMAVLAATPVLGHYLGYAFFYSTWGAYPAEAAPLLCVLAALGAITCREVSLGSQRPLLALYGPVLIGVNLLAGALVLPRLVELRREETAYHRRLTAVEARLPERPALLLLKLDLTQPHPYDPICNDPFLQSPVIRAIDPGEPRRHRLMEHFPERAVYLYDERTGELRLLRSPLSGVHR